MLGEAKNHCSFTCGAPSYSGAGTLGTFFAATVLAALLVAHSAAIAQPPSPDGFNPGANNYVYSMAVQPDGSILVGGTFASLGGMVRSNIARVSAEGSLDTRFNPGAKGSINCIVLQNDGKILVAGGFTNLAGRVRNHIGRLNPDGTPDDSFTQGVSPAGYLNALALEANGKVLVGGRFDVAGGQPRTNFARLNPDGSLDSGFDLGANGPVHTIAVQADGKVLLGGAFSRVGGQPRTNLARLNVDGSLDNGFTADAGGGSYPFYGSVVCLGLQPDGKILVGGFFTSLCGQPRNYIGRLDANGGPDAGFDASAGGTSASMVHTIVLQSDGRIVVGGYFSGLGGQPRDSLGRLMADGALDTSFNAGANDIVYALALQEDGKLLVGGGFGALGGMTRNRIGRLFNTEAAIESGSYDGTTATWLRGGTGPEISYTVFEESGDGVTWSALGAGVRIPGGWELSGLAVPPGNTIRVQGCATGGRDNASSWFAQTMIGTPAFVAQPTSCTNNAGTAAVFRAVADGSPPLTFQWFKNGAVLNDGGNVSGAQTSALLLTNLLKADEGGYRLRVSNSAGGKLSEEAVLGVVDPIITLHPASQQRREGETATFNVSGAGTALCYQWLKDGAALTQATNAVLTLTNLVPADAADYSAIVSNNYGSVTSATAVLTLNVATLDRSFSAGLGGLYQAASSVAVQPDGKILVVGLFGSVQGQPRSQSARLNADGTLDEGFHPTVVGAMVYLLALQGDGKTILGGNFTAVCGEARTNLARLNEDGTLDGAFNPAVGGLVNVLGLQADGKLLVGGPFTNICGQARKYLVRLNPDGTLDAAFNPQPNDYIYSLSVQSDGRILIGGGFSAVGGRARANLARINTDGTLDTNFNPTISGNPPQVISIAEQPDGKILVAGEYFTVNGKPRRNICRLNADGTLDTAFDPNADDWVGTVGLQADGKILLAGGFTTIGGQPRIRLARLTPSGALDSKFCPEASADISTLAIQPDGMILVAGYFQTLAGAPCSGLGRLNSTSLASQKLDYDGTNVTWLRGGTGPEVWHTRFDQSVDGITWAFLGDGGRTVGGWRLTNVFLSPGAVLRARGNVLGDSFGSLWYTECGWPLAVPTISCGPNNSGALQGQVALGVAGTAGSFVAIEASTNLQQWVSLRTNMLPSGGLPLSDPSSTNFPQRFYRCRLVE